MQDFKIKEGRKIYFNKTDKMKLTKKEQEIILQGRLNKLRANPSRKYSKKKLTPKTKKGKRHLTPQDLNKRIEKGRTKIRNRFPTFSGAMDNLARNMWS